MRVRAWQTVHRAREAQSSCARVSGHDKRMLDPVKTMCNVNTMWAVRSQVTTKPLQEVNNNITKLPPPTRPQGQQDKHSHWSDVSLNVKSWHPSSNLAFVLMSSWKQNWPSIHFYKLDLVHSTFFSAILSFQLLPMAMAAGRKCLLFWN